MYFFPTRRGKFSPVESVTCPARVEIVPGGGGGTNVNLSTSKSGNGGAQACVVASVPSSRQRDRTLTRITNATRPALAVCTSASDRDQWRGEDDRV